MQLAQIAGAYLRPQLGPSSFANLYHQYFYHWRKKNHLSVGNNKAHKHHCDLHICVQFLASLDFVKRHNMIDLKGKCGDALGGCGEEADEWAKEDSHGKSAIEVGEGDEDDNYWLGNHTWADTAAATGSPTACFVHSRNHLCKIGRCFFL